MKKTTASISRQSTRPSGPKGIPKKSYAKDKRGQKVQSYLDAALSDNTLRAYRADIKHFIKWGGAIPASGDTIAQYIADNATSLSCSTLSRRVVAINRAHAVKGFPSPTSTDMVRATLQGIRRKHGKAPHQVTALQKHDLLKVVKHLKGLRGMRDYALLMIGFAAALRRSELVSLDVEDIKFVKEGAVLHLRRSKTDQEGRGREIAIPFVHGPYCPCRTLQAWLKLSKITSGPIFRRIDKYDNILANRLTAQSVALIIKKRAASAGLDPILYSGHSLRAGFATNAARAGASNSSIRSQTGHKSDSMLQRYIRPSRAFSDNPNRKVW